MRATDVAPTRLDAAKVEVKALVRGLGGADRMLVAQMDAMVTRWADERRHRGARTRGRRHRSDRHARTSTALRFATDALRGATSRNRRGVGWGARSGVGFGGGVHLGDVKLSFVPSARAPERRAHAVLRPPLSARQESLRGDARVTNTGDAQEDVEVSLLGDGQLVDLTKLRLQPASDCRGSIRTCPAQSHPGSERRARRRLHDDLPRTTTPSRSCLNDGARRCSSFPTESVLAGALLLDNTSR